MISDHQTSFNGGQFAPLLHYRTDLEKSRSAFRDGVNLLCSPYGPVSKRPGLLYVAPAYVDGGSPDPQRSRLIPWQFAADDGYILEFANGVFRVFKDGAAVMDGAEPLEVATPYDHEDIFEIQFIQINDIGYFVHPNHHPKKLSRFADDNWTLVDVDWTYPPLRDTNLSEITLTPSATTGTITLTASADLFDAGHVGGYFQVGHERLATEYQTKIILNADLTSSEILIQGEYLFYTSGNWRGEVTIERYDPDEADWVAVRTFESDADQNYETGGEFRDMTRVRLVFDDFTGSTANRPRAVLEAASAQLDGLVKITAVTNATTATAEVVTQLAKAEETDLWREGAFSDFRGFARTVAIHDMRVVLGSTRTDRQTIWGSAVDDYERFQPGTKDDDAFKLTIASGAHDEIEWMVSQKSLLVGTSGGEWVLSSGSDETVITPSNARARRQSNYGSAFRQAVVVDDAALFLRAGGERLAQMAFYFEKDGYASEDLTLLSYHVGAGGFQQLAYKRKREPAIYGVNGNGQLAVMSYNRGQQVTGWTLLETSGEFESVAVLSTGGDEDEVWAVVKRDIDGNEVRYIERFDPESWLKVEAGSTDMCFLDSAVVIESNPAAGTVSGLDHLEGRMVAMLIDGAAQDPVLVVGGVAETSYDVEGSTIVAGLPFEARLVPMPRAGNGGNGALLGREYKLNELVFFFYRTISTKYGRRGGDKLWDIPFRTTAGDYGEPPELFTGALKVKTDGKHEIDAGIEIRSSEPFPFTLTGLVTKFNVEGS